jgi:hypothetical protein
VVVEDQEHDRRTEQPQPDREHADDAAGPERCLEAALSVSAARRRRDPDIRLGGQRHADVAHRRGEHRPDQEEQRSAELHNEPAVINRQREEKQEHDDGEDAQGAELAIQVSASALLHSSGDVLHLRRALIGLQHILDEPVREPQSGQC